MPIVLPFRAVRPAGAPDPSSRLSPPYDVIAPDERVRLAKDPHNAVHLELPESHAGARTLLDAWMAGGALVRRRLDIRRN